MRSALSPQAPERKALLDHTDGYDLMEAPPARIPTIVVGSAHQSVQWIAVHGEAWATYHRPETRQQSRISLWRGALEQSANGADKPFIQSMLLDLVKSPSAQREPLDLGMRTGRHVLIDYLRRLKELGVGHVLFGLVRGERPMSDVIQEIGEEVIPKV